jgi:nucleoid DNA-binding protein
MIYDYIQNVMEKKKVSIAGFGTFSNVHVHARMGRNPGTGEQISISARQRVKFSPFKALKDAANGK